MKIKALMMVLLLTRVSYAQDFWQPVLASAGYVVTLSANSYGLLFATSYTAGVFRSTDGGLQWTAVNHGLTFSSALGFTVSPLNDDLYVSSGNRIYSSSNNGDSWILRDSISFPSGAWRMASSVDGTLFALNDTLRRSSDGGVTWTTAHNGLPFGSMQDLQIDPDGNVYVARKGDWVFRSTNNGDSWIRLVSPAPPLPYVDADAVAFGRNGELYVGDDGDGFFKSTDDGNSWQQLNTGLPNYYVWALAVTNEGHLFAGLARDGIYRSTDGGVHWDSVNGGLGSDSRRIYSLYSGPSGYLFAGTISGIYRSVQPVLPVRNTVWPEPGEFKLYQNYPNPFNPSTTIRYMVLKPSLVRIVVYDIVGREVALLVNEETAAGEHTVQFNAGGLASGVYFYRLVAGNYHDVKKLAVLR